MFSWKYLLWGLCFLPSPRGSVMQISTVVWTPQNQGGWNYQYHRSRCSKCWLQTPSYSKLTQERQIMARSNIADVFPWVDPVSEIICRLTALMKRRGVTEFTMKVLSGKLSGDAIRVKSKQVNFYWLEAYSVLCMWKKQPLDFRRLLPKSTDLCNASRILPPK